MVHNRHMSVANPKRASLASSMASGAAACKLRAQFGGGATAPPARLVRGSTGWLRNRDAIATAVDPRDLPRGQCMRASARFGRRTSVVANLAELKKKQRSPPPPPITIPATTTISFSSSSSSSSSLPPPPPTLVATPPVTAMKEVRLAEVDDGVSEVERLAWTTFHWTPAQLVAAGHDPDVVRAPAVLAAVRTRFLHSPNIMLNSNFDCNFSVNQGAFKRILRRKYGFKATYMPVNYPGMRCPFVLRRGVPLDPLMQPGHCEPEDRGLCVKSQAFARKYVKATFILFRTGNAFLRGSFSEEVMAFVYRQFARILVDEYHHIVTRDTSPDSKDHHSVVKTRVAYFGTDEDGNVGGGEAAAAAAKPTTA